MNYLIPFQRMRKLRIQEFVICQKVDLTLEAESEPELYPTCSKSKSLPIPSYITLQLYPQRTSVCSCMQWGVGQSCDTGMEESKVSVRDATIGRIFRGDGWAPSLLLSRSHKLCPATSSTHGCMEEKQGHCSRPIWTWLPWRLLWLWKSLLSKLMT